jgi:hypothetical protein
MRHLMLFAGQEDNYQAGAKYMEQFLRIKADDSQIHRLCTYYGKALEEENSAVEGQIVASSEALRAKLGEEEVVYAMMDGCQLPTRPCQSEQETIGSWKEMKLGRVFIESEHLDLGKKPNVIRSSLYMSHFGKHDGFTNKFEQVVDTFDSLDERLVFINDGASWIEKWIVTAYPNATDILDFFHAAEYLHDFSKVLFSKQTQKEEAEKWVQQQRDALLEDQVQQVIDQIARLELQGKAKLEAQQKIVTYYTNNQHRMYYKTYRNRGLLIGSGPIESAHRFVLHKRLKQSGQKWTQQGGQAVANLRVVHLNQQWDRVINLINKCHFCPN